MAESQAAGTVATLTVAGGYASGHEQVTRAEVARRVAALKGYVFGGEHDPARPHPGPLYAIPGDTLVAEDAAALGIADEHALFGGVVPHPFAATKAITHPLIHPGATAPPGWSTEFGEAVAGSVLPGWSAFTPGDARHAAALLLPYGPVRLKRVRATAGRGQFVAADGAALDQVLDALDPAEIAADGLVLEQNLSDVTTYSVGQVRVADLVATYHGTQSLTRDNEGAEVYGGSTLTIVRGGFEDLAALASGEALRLAVMQARAYDAAVDRCFPGFFASRRNYDVARGRDAAGDWRSGVLEQSWRIGGATGAEVAALEAFRADPALRAVRAATVEVYGGGAAPPGATVYFDGRDDRMGPMLKYAAVLPP